MNIKDFAIQVLNMNSKAKREMAIANLKNGLEKEARWDYNHRAEVKVLIQFLESDSNDIADLKSYCPVS